MEKTIFSDFSCFQKLLEKDKNLKKFKWIYRRIFMFFTILIIIIVK